MKTKAPLNNSEAKRARPLKDKKHLSLSLFLLLLLSLCGHAENWDLWLAKRGYVDVRTIDASIRVQLVYATPFNFMGQAVYRGMLSKAWLHPDAAAKLALALKNLKREHPDYSFLVYDAARPVAVQRGMWNLVKGTENSYYVSDPDKKIGRHIYGMAVDITIIDRSGRPVPMGTPFDFFGEEAHTDNEPSLLKAGKISPQAYRNRLLLRRVMQQAGFTTVTSEWWHFNACSGEEAIRRYQRIE